MVTVRQSNLLWVTWKVSWYSNLACRMSLNATLHFIYPGVLVKYRHSWSEQLCLSSHTPEEICLAAGFRSYDRNVSSIWSNNFDDNEYWRTCFSLNNWIGNLNSTTTTTRTVNRSPVSVLWSKSSYNFSFAVGFPCRDCVQPEQGPLWSS